MSIKIINTLNDVEPEQWDALIQTDYPFLKHAFLLALEQSGSVSAESGWLPHHLVQYENNKLMAAMPLYLKFHSWGEYVFDQPWANAYETSNLDYYPKWLNAIPFSPCQGPRFLIHPQKDYTSCVNQFLTYMKQLSAKNQISGFHCLFPEQQQLEPIKDQLLIRQGVQFHWHNKNYRDFKDYLDSFNSRQRKKIRKERLKVQNQGIELVQKSGKEISEQEWQTFYNFYQMTYLKNGQSGYLNLQFFLQLAETMNEQILLIIAQKDQNAVAAALSLKSEDTLYGRYWGCLQDYKFLHFECCYYQGLDYCIQHQLNTFDSGAQGEHKISRGFEPIDTYSAHWLQNPQFSKLIARFLEREKPHIQHYKENCRTLLPFKQASSGTK